MSQPNGDYAYWESSQQDVVYPMPTGSILSKEESLIEAVQSLQKSLAKQQPPLNQNQSAIAVPGSGLSLIIETDTARLRIAFEPK